MDDSTIATSADYADAMLVARRAKNWLFLILLLVLLIEIALFFIARYTTAIAPAYTTAAATSQAVTAPATTLPAQSTLSSADKIRYLNGLTTFIGTVLPVLLSFVLLIILHIMLVGRLIGVSRVTSAYVWCLVLMLILFPWQAFFGASTNPTDFRFPGVLFTWDDLMLAKFPTTDLSYAILKWARFFIWPLVALILLLVVQVKSSRGVKQALGESPVASSPPSGVRGSEPNITV
jgi:hypothetical protein